MTKPTNQRNDMTKFQERQQLLEALAHSKQNELAGLSPEEIQKRLDALDE